MTPSTNALSDAKRALLEQRLKGKRGIATIPPTLSAIPRRPLVEEAPLSFAQQRMWFLYQLEPHSPAYNMSHGLYLRGPLHVEMLHHALNAIVRRHATLRTTYGESEAGIPVQCIHSPRPIELHRIDLMLAPSSHNEEESGMVALLDTPLVSTEETGEGVRSLREFARIEAATPFELSKEFPLRATLVSLAPEQHLLLLTLHHIAADGWSWGLFFNDLRAAYGGASLAELSLEYADFASWQRETLEAEGGIEKQLAYWRQELAGAPPLLELPTDYPRPAVQQTTGAMARVSLPATLTAELHAFSRAHNSTIFMTLLALFQLLLHRYSGAATVVVGSPIAGRTRPELEPLIGVFINTLALRSRFYSGITFRDLLAQMRDTTLNAYAHQDLPFERLVEALNPERTLSYSPIFQSQFVFHNNPQSDFHVEGLAIGWLPPDREVTKFDLSLSLYEDSGEVKGGLVYNTSLYNQATIERMVGHWRVLAGAAIHHPDAPVATLPLLTEPEAHDLLFAWNQSHLPVPTLALHEQIQAQVARTPTTTALVCEAESLTYAEWDRRANQVARALIAHGVQPERRVALFADRSLAWMVGMYGTLKAGGAYTPIDPLTPAERLAGMVIEAGATVLLTQRHLVTELPDLPCPVLVLDDTPSVFAAYSETPPPVTVLPHHIAYILFTSGSTGRPKGVAVEHGQITNYLHAILARADFPAGASFAIVSTLAADLGNTTLFPAMVTGGTLHIIPYERATDPIATADYFRTHRIDCLKIVPSHFEAWLTAPNPADVVPHQRLIFGGEASSWELMTRIRALRPGVKILNHYGPTETTVGVLTCAVPDIPIAGAAIVPLGRPLGNTHLYVLDQTGQPLPVGVPGELFIGGAQVTRGYLGRPGLTAERFVPNPFSDTPGARLYRTGDRVRYLPGGNLEFLGRVDFQVKVRGYRIEPGEIEAVLKHHPAIREAVVMVREDQPGDKRLVGYVVERTERGERRKAENQKKVQNGHPVPPSALPLTDETGNSLSIADLRTYLRAQLPDYMVPSAFVMLEQLPLNANGKIERRVLPAPDAQRDTTTPFTAPGTPQEIQVAAVWQEILGVEQIGIDDNFFDVGGESFKAIRVVRKLDSAMSVMTLFKYPTIRELAHVLGSETPVADQGLLHELTKPLLPAHTTLTLICIPYGGASAISYRPLAEVLPPGMKLLAVELPGHDFSRPDEPLAPLQEVAGRIVAEIQTKVTGPSALYGHCVGTALTTEIARQLEEANIIPESVFLAGAFPQPRLPGKLFQWWSKVASRDRLLSDRVYHDFLRSLGGFNDTLDPVELTFTMRNLRHDFNESEAYYTAAYEQGAPRTPKLQAPVVCIVGEKDRATEYYPERYAEWRDFAHSVRLAIVRHAGHFFLKHQPAAIADIIERQLKAIRVTDRPSPVAVTPSGESPAKPSPRHIHTPAKSSSPRLTTFFIVAFGQLISMIGSGLTSFALGIWVFQQTAAVADLSLIAMLSLLPGILALPIAGAMVDRVDRRKLMLLADVVAMTRTLVVAGLLATNSLSLWHIYIAVTVGSIVGAFQRPAYVAAMAQLVPKKYLGHANGIVQFATAAGQSLAPILAAALVATIRLEGVLLLDVVSYIVAITILLMVRFPTTLWRKREEPLHQEIYNGWRYIATRRPLVAMVVFFCISNLLLAGMTVLLTPYGLALGNEATLGMIMTAGSLGLMAGGILMSAWGGTRRRAEGMVGFVALEGLFMVLMGSVAHPWVAMVGLFGFQLAIALSNGHWQALIQTKVPFDLHGRVFAINQMLAWSTMPVGYLVVGWLADHVFTTTVAGQLGSTAQGLGLFIVIIGVLTAAVGVLGMTYRTLRYMEEALPDPYADSVITQSGDPGTIVLFDPHPPATTP